MSEENKNENLRPSKMRGVAFPKAKYGVVLAIIIIILVYAMFTFDERKLLWNNNIKIFDALIIFNFFLPLNKVPIALSTSLSIATVHWAEIKRTSKKHEK